MKILLWFQMNWGIIIAIISILIAIIGGATGKFNALLAQVMLFAEKALASFLENKGKLTGLQKKEFVIDFVYNKIPTWTKLVITRSYIALKVELMIKDIYDLQDDGVLNCSVKFINKKE